MIKPAKKGQIRRREDQFGKEGNAWWAQGLAEAVVRDRLPGKELRQNKEEG